MYAVFSPCLLLFSLIKFFLCFHHWFGASFLFVIFEGCYLQYDTVMYPEKKTKGYFGRIGDWVSGGSSTIPPNESMHQKCLTTYLERLQNDLMRCEIPANWTVDHIVAFAMQVVTSLTAQRIAHSDKPAVWNDEKLLMVSTCNSRCMQQYM